MQIISAGKFKVKCFKLIGISQTGEEYTITKKGVPIARIVPLETNIDPFGFLKGTVTCFEDLSLISSQEII